MKLALLIVLLLIAMLLLGDYAKKHSTEKALTMTHIGIIILLLLVTNFLCLLLVTTIFSNDNFLFIWASLIMIITTVIDVFIFKITKIHTFISHKQLSNLTLLSEIIVQITTIIALLSSLSAIAPNDKMLIVISAVIMNFTTVPVYISLKWKYTHKNV